MAEVIVPDSNELFLLEAQWKKPWPVVRKDLVHEEYIIDGSLQKTDKYDLVLYQNTWLSLQNIVEGRTYTLILNVFDTSESSLPPIPLPVLLFFNSLDGDVIKWYGLDADYPSINTNAKIEIYKSRGVLYCTLIKPFIGGNASS